MLNCLDETIYHEIKNFVFLLGIYISMNDTKVPEKYRGICIRIEDDVLITKDGVEVLTTSCPKQAEEIEKLIQSEVLS